MFYSYVLKSLKTGRRYYGSCADLTIRLARYNAGKVKSTKPYIPYEIIFSEVFSPNAFINLQKA